MFEDTVTKADLLLTIKNLREQVRQFESGAKYVQMKKECEAIHRADLRAIEKMRIERDKARIETRHVTDIWYKTTQDIVKECNRKVAEKEREIEALKEKLINKDENFKKEHKARLFEIKEKAKAERALADEIDKNEKLQKQLKKDYRTSSESSMMNPNHPPIQNSRKKTGKKPGGQPEHEHHGRKKLEPTKRIHVPEPEEYLDISKYKATGKEITKQLIKLHVVPEVTEYYSKEYRNIETGQRVHAVFPEGLVDDVTYDSSVKAMAYLVNNGLYTSVVKTKEFIKDITNGKVDLSCGFISNLSKEFSDKTEDERSNIFRNIMASPLMHADFTFGHSADGQTTVMICATENAVIYLGRPKKGDEGVKETPLENYDGIVVSDHESAIKKKGGKHQECLAHILRYILCAMLMEKDKTWHKKAADWITRGIAYWNEVNEGIREYSGKVAGGIIDELKEILKLADKEYREKPASKYYTEGKNTFSRMNEDLEEYVLFLRDPQVPPTNNKAERYARKYKRKDHQVMAFRNHKGSYLFCDGLTIIESVRAKGENLFEALTERFSLDTKVLR